MAANLQTIKKSEMVDMGEAELERKPLATSTSEMLMQKVIKQFSIRRLLRLDLTNDNALRYQGTSV